MTYEQIFGTIEFQDERSGAFKTVGVRFRVEEGTPWVDVVDAGVKRAEEILGINNRWVATGVDTLSSRSYE